MYERIVRKGGIVRREKGKGRSRLLKKRSFDSREKEKRRVVRETRRGEKNLLPLSQNNFNPG